MTTLIDLRSKKSFLQYKQRFVNYLKSSLVFKHSMYDFSVLKKKLKMWFTFRSLKKSLKMYYTAYFSLVLAVELKAEYSKSVSIVSETDTDLATLIPSQAKAYVIHLFIVHN